MNVITDNRKILKIKKIKKINTVLRVKADSSIAHSALIALSQCNGISEIQNVPKCHSIMITILILNLLGVKIEVLKENRIIIFGRGIGSFVKSNTLIDVQNSTMAASVFLGLLSSYKFNSFITSETRNMEYKLSTIISILSNSGIKFLSKTLPLAIAGDYVNSFLPIQYNADISLSSRDISALLFYAINVEGNSLLSEPVSKRRNHTENILKLVGAKIKTYIKNDFLCTEIVGKPELRALGSIIIPNDASLSLYYAIIATFLNDSYIEIRNVCVNESRIGVHKILLKMGVNIEVNNNVSDYRKSGFIDDIGDIIVKSSQKIIGINLDSILASEILMEDYPLIITIAALAHGETKIKHLSFLEKNRIINITLNILTFFGISFEKNFNTDELIIHGNNFKHTVNSSNYNYNNAILNLRYEYRSSLCALILGMNSNKEEVFLQNINFNAYQYYKSLHKFASY